MGLRDEISRINDIYNNKEAIKEIIRINFKSNVKLLEKKILEVYNENKGLIGRLSSERNINKEFKQKVEK